MIEILVAHILSETKASVDVSVVTFAANVSVTTLFPGFCQGSPKDARVNAQLKSPLATTKGAISVCCFLIGH